MARRPASRSAVTAKAAAQAPLFAIDCLDVEDEVRASGFRRIAGVDEVGRGCWAGPVYAAAVVLPDACYDDRALLAEVTDSKLLTPARRERLSRDILDLATAAAVGWAEAPVIDQLNILGATRLAMRAALSCLNGAPAGGPGWGARHLLAHQSAPDYVLVDAVRLPEVPLPQRPVIRGDRCCLSVAAASIVAKVLRDEDMCRRATVSPSFALDHNKGYGTRAHITALRRHGVTPLHRRSFAPMKYLLGLRDHIAGSLPSP